MFPYEKKERAIIRNWNTRPNVGLELKLNNQNSSDNCVMRFRCVLHGAHTHSLLYMNI